MIDLDERFRAALLAAVPAQPVVDHEPAVDHEPVVNQELASGLDWWTLFTAQARSRHLDLAARRLQQAGRGFYTIGSAGHESNALVALATGPGDPSLLHYRSGGFYCARASQVAGSTPVRDVLQGLMGLADEPIAGGRHKVFGHHRLGIIPQTSTIASHLPRAVGLAVSLHRAQRLGVSLATETPWADDAVVIASFGDASANHSTATGAINTALNAAYRGLPVRLLLVCEDNGLGISVPTPTGWIEQAYRHRPGLHYVAADGADPAAAWTMINSAVRVARTGRTPVFLHLKTVRFSAHAGSDAEISYRRAAEIEADLERDPLLATARSMIISGRATAEALLAGYDDIAAEVARESLQLQGSRTLSSAAEIMAPLSPRRPALVAAQVSNWTQRKRQSLHKPGAPAPEAVGPPTPAPPTPAAGPAPTPAPAPAPAPAPGTLAESINRTLGELLDAERSVMIFGEDVGRKGGVYGVTRGLARRHGAARVFDTLLDEQSILGLALGAGLAGLMPIPEIQYLAYLHNAEDQLRGEAASLAFFSQGQYRNPLVTRIAGLGYQKGFGGHFHNDNGVAVLRDIPGLVVACPARGDDAAAMLRTLVAAAMIDGTVSVHLEPIALYHTRDLHTPGDNAWLGVDHAGVDHAGVDHAGHVPIGAARSYPLSGAATAELTMITFGNGVPMSLRVQRRLAESTPAIATDVLDLRWLAPLPVDDLVAAANRTGRVLIVDETRHTGGVGEGVITALVEAGFRGPIRRVSSQDSFVPLGAAAQQVLLGEDEIVEAAVELAREDRG